LKTLLLIFGALFLFSISIYSQQISKEKEPLNNSFGIGIGVPYGIIGGNIDLNIISNINGSFGLGTTYFSGASYNVGLKLFFTNALQVFRPRAFIFYGINSVDKYERTDDNNSYSGLSFGLGSQFLWHKTKWGFDFDVVYIATSTKGKIDPKNSIKISVGFRRGF